MIVARLDIGLPLRSVSLGVTVSCRVTDVCLSVSLSVCQSCLLTSPSLSDRLCPPPPPFQALSGEIVELQRSARLPQLPAPSPVDEAHISRLLEQSASGAEPRPLHHLQACLHSLKQEMSALQTQIHRGDAPQM